MTETAPQSTPSQKSKLPFLFTISEKNETAFKIKKIATGVHYISLIISGLLYMASSDKTFNCFVLAASSFVLAMFIPPTGMISTDDAPEYAKNAMSYLPQPDGTVGPVVPESMRKKKSSKGSRKKKN